MLLNLLYVYQLYSGFRTLMLEDQMALLKSSFLEISVLRLAYRCGILSKFRHSMRYRRMQLLDTVAGLIDTMHDVGWWRHTHMHVCTQVVTAVECQHDTLLAYCISRKRRGGITSQYKWNIMFYHSLRLFYLTCKLQCCRSLGCFGKLRFRRSLVMDEDQHTRLGWSETLFRDMIEFVDHLRRLSIDLTEFAILNAVVLTYSG